MSSVFTHPYILVVAGIVLWQLEQHLTKPNEGIKTRVKMLGRSMIWGGGLVAFDDEIIGFFNIRWLVTENGEAEWYAYIVGGFLIDLIRNRITKQ